LQTENWIRNTPYPDRGEREEYTSGFHVFATREIARKAMKFFHGNLQVVKVKVRNVTAEGFDGSDRSASFLALRARTLVAQEIFIPLF